MDKGPSVNKRGSGESASVASGTSSHSLYYSRKVFLKSAMLKKSVLHVAK